MPRSDPENGATPTPVRVDHVRVAYAAAEADPAARAELTAESGGRWYLLKVELHKETIAAAHLVARRFGVYLPGFRELERAGNGKRRQVTRLLFPGQLFVFVWDLDAHRRRIRACPCVVDVEYYASCPVSLPDQVIDWIQLTEARLDGYRGSRKRKGWRKQALIDFELGDKLTIRPRNAITDVALLDDAARSEQLRQLLVPPEKRIGRGRRPEPAKT